MNPRWTKWRRPKIKHGVPTKWLWVVYYPENLELGPFTDIGAFSALFCHKRVEIQEGAQLGAFTVIYTVNTEDGTSGPVVIERGARIGAHSFIAPGVTIGRNARVGAYSFVKQSIPAGALAFGIPAKVRVV